ncbi:MAG TPA: FHA domain-containing protein [Kofleriaceae bacterium]|jgi:pSer/pThr/pTyr-binding forkhead associated (FHA) protein/ribosomal protein L40E|nr:FHA domain-containing protein [Kofleriaceae bacterium]
MCGHESPAGSSFCLNCGSSFAGPQVFAQPSPQTPLAGPGLPGIIVCGACRGENPPGMKFCRSCGSALAQTNASLPAYGGGPAFGGPGLGLHDPGPPSPAALGLMPTGMVSPVQFGGPPQPLPPAQLVPTLLPPPPRAEDSTVTCPRCGTQTPLGFAYCQQCGLNMQALQPADPGSGARLRPPSSAPPMAPTMAPSLAPMPPPLAPMAPPLAGRADGRADGRIDGPIDPHAGTLAQDGLQAGPLESLLSRAAPAPAPQPRPQAGPAWGTAVLVNRDGSDGQRYPLSGEYLVIGRAGADIAFEDDRFLARQHARIERGGDGAVTVHPLDTLNGVFRKTDAPVELSDGMTILVGREVLRFERVDPEETKLHPLVRHGVALFGSPPREPWGRMVQLVPSGGYRDVRHLFADEVVLGREEGDIVFRDDAFMSRRHAAVTWNGKQAQLTDLGSSNGTFVRITGPTAVKHGDHVRMGDQLLRVELAR